MSIMQYVFEMYFLCKEPSLKVDVDSNTHLSVMLGKASWRRPDWTSRQLETRNRCGENTTQLLSLIRE